METSILPLFLFVGCAAAVAALLIAISGLLGPRRDTLVKEMPYESGMDPIHDARRKFDFRFHLVAIAFLLFDVELVFLYPWAVAARAGGGSLATSQVGLNAAVAGGLVSGRGLVFAGAMFFVALLVAGLIYDWRKGVFRWR
jgi:NADH-quinone oxidoreductase subunit A